MSLDVDVTLLSGKSAQISAPGGCTVDEFRSKAQTALQVGRSRLISPSGHVLCGEATLFQSGVKNGDILTLQVQQMSLAATADSFAAILGDGSVVTWGGSRAGGDSTSVKDQLKLGSGVVCMHDLCMCVCVYVYIYTHTLYNIDFLCISIHMLLVSVFWI